MSVNVGLVGLGNMGFPIAQRLRERSFVLSTYDSQAEALKRASEEGLVTVASLTDLGHCPTILLSLPNPSVVRAVVRELLPSIVKGTVLIDLSTNDPETARALGGEAVERNAAYIDAPVSGGPSRARSGELTLMVGGDDEAVRHAWPLLTVLGKQVEHVGSSGAGTIAKLLNNYVALWGMVGVSQALLAAKALGVSQQRLYEVMAKSSGRSYSLDRNAPKIISRNFRSDFSLDLAQKDLRLALELMQDVGLEPFARSELQDLFARSVRSDGSRDVAAIYETLRTAEGASS